MSAPTCPALYPDWYLVVALILVAVLIAVVAVTSWRKP
jgi:hypothetical protein